VENPHTRPMGINMELVARRRDGEEIPVEVSLSTFQSDDRELVICIVRDVSEQRKVKNEALLANRQLESTVAALGALNNQIRELGEFGKLMISCRDHQEVRSVIKTFCEKFFPESSGTVLLTNASRNAMELEVAWGAGSQTAKSHVLVGDCWALRRGTTHHHNEVKCAACQIDSDCSGLQNVQCIPMIGQGEIRGVVRLCSANTTRQTMGDACFNQELTTAVTDRIGLALANLQLRVALREQAIRDPLTNLYNRRFMVEFMERELSRATRSAAPLSVLALDLDHFKTFNDSFGHPAGDRILEAFGQLLYANIRSGDVPCRFGGEEFIVLLPETHADIAVKRAESIRKAVEQLSVTHAGQLLRTITVSIGVAATPGDGVSVDTLLRAADQALYRAKQLGRNRVIVASGIQNDIRNNDGETAHAQSHDPVTIASR
jgi:diguanylate cyclase (GGDEF)-like protein